MTQNKITIDEVDYIAVDGKTCQDCDFRNQRCSANRANEKIVEM